MRAPGWRWRKSSPFSMIIPIFPTNRENVSTVSDASVSATGRLSTAPCPAGVRAPGIWSRPLRARLGGHRLQSCGNCAQACPTGALTLKRRYGYREWEVKKVRTTCPHCATGCQMDLVVKGDRIVSVESADGPSNHFLMCVKGRSGSFDFVHSDNRLRTPLIKNRETGKFEPATWEEAINYAAGAFMDIRRQYGRSLAGFACSRSANEDIYMVQKMVRTCFGNNNTDNCARVCHSATVAGLAKTLGSGAMTNPIYDITHDVDCIFR